MCVREDGEEEKKEPRTTSIIIRDTVSPGVEQLSEDDPERSLPLFSVSVVPGRHVHTRTHFLFTLIPSETRFARPAARQEDIPPPPTQPHPRITGTRARA